MSRERAATADAAALPSLRIGIDLGGTKIAGVALASDGSVRASLRIPSPRGDYDATIRALREKVAALEPQAGEKGSLGIGMPGSMSRATGLVQGSNSTWLNGKPLDRDLEGHLGRPVRLANDANCFALSEAVDGAGAGQPSGPSAVGRSRCSACATSPSAMATAPCTPSLSPMTSTTSSARINVR